MKKKFIIAGVIIFTVIAGGYAAYWFGVNFLFDKYVLNAALSSITDDAEGDWGKTTEGIDIPPLSSEDSGETSGDVFKQQETDEKSKTRLSREEIIMRVIRSSKLTRKMASMVPYEDKRRIIKIILSNFSADELTKIVKNVSKGMDSEYRSQIIADAKSRLTPQQWQECLDIAYKYIEKIRPYVE